MLELSQRQGAPMTDVIHLSTDALVQSISDEYAVIFESERNTLPKALALGGKLVELQDGVEHGEWKPYLEKRRLQISYETAAVYMRVYNKQEKWRELAAAKNVDPAFLTIERVLNLLAKSKLETSGSGGDKDNP